MARRDRLASVRGDRRAAPEGNSFNIPFTFSDGRPLFVVSDSMPLTGEAGRIPELIGELFRATDRETNPDLEGLLHQLESTAVDVHGDGPDIAAAAALGLSLAQVAEKCGEPAVMFRELADGDPHALVWIQTVSQFLERSGGIKIDISHPEQ